MSAAGDRHDETRPHRPVPPGPQLGIAAVCALAVVLAVMWWWQGRPEATPVTRTAVPAAAPAVSAGPSAPSPAPSPSIGPSSAAPPAPSVDTVTVDVRGVVVRPGPRRLPVGSRVIDAIEAAGGLRGGRSYGPVNLARVLADGEQIRVGPNSDTGVAGAAPAPATGATPASSGGGLIDLNTATEAELEELDGVGPVLAGAIVRWRTENGAFTQVEDLLDVSGIGDATLESLRPQVTVG